MHPILFRIPAGWMGHPNGIPVFSYGALLALSTFLGWWLTRRLAARHGDFSVAQGGWAFVVTVASAMLGARVLYVLTNLERFDSVRHMLAFSDGGLVVYGGFLGGFFGAWAYCAANRLSILAWGDAAVPSMALGVFITRVGCLLYGCDYGRPFDGAWAVRFPPGSPAYNNQRLEGLLPEHAPSSLPVHPTQLYESAVGLALFLLSLWMWRRRTLRGEVMIVFAMCYAVPRFFLEMLRADRQRGGYGGLTTSQIIGMVTFSAAAFLWVWMRRTAPIARPSRVD